jgi:hypothetical protein
MTIQPHEVENKLEEQAKANAPRAADLIREIAALLLRHIVFKDTRYALLIATWVLGTYIHKCFTFYGYLHINSPTKRCGKSLLEDILAQLCCNATGRLSNVSEAAIFRLAHAGHTLIIDELENVRGEDKDRYQMIMTILNAGFQAGATVPRVEKQKDAGFVIVKYNAYSAKVLAGINKLADTIEDRSFQIAMTRKAPTEHVERFNLRKQRKDLAKLRQGMSAWADARRNDVEALYDQLDATVDDLKATDDRFQDIAEPLLAIALLADAEIANGAERIKPQVIDALLALAGRRTEAEKDSAIAAMVEILADVLGDEECTFIPSGDLLAKAQATQGLAWLKSTKALATFLGKLDLFAGHDTTKTVRGYTVKRWWVDDVQNRYCFLYSGFKPSEASQTRAQSGLEGIL